ncbi:MAG: OsmC family protein [Phycisphaeraceae bacterium]
MAIQHQINGLDMDQLQETVGQFRQQPEFARFKFHANHRWLGAAHSQTKIDDFYGTCQTHHHDRAFIFDADEPPLLLGKDEGANPVEYVLTALAGCLTTALVFSAAAKGIRVDEVEAELHGDLDVRGFLGIDPNVRNGYQNIDVKFRIKSDAPREQLEQLIADARGASPVFDVLTHPVPVQVSLAE